MQSDSANDMHPPSPQDGLVPHNAHTLALALHLGEGAPIPLLPACALVHPAPSPQDGLMPHDAHTLALTLHLGDDGLQALNDVLVGLASGVPERPSVDTIYGGNVWIMEVCGKSYFYIRVWPRPHIFRREIAVLDASTPVLNPHLYTTIHTCTAACRPRARHTRPGTSPLPPRRSDRRMTRR